MSRLRSILARGSIHRVYHGGHCMCVCLCVCLPLPATLPPMHPPDVHRPSIKFAGGQRQHVSRLLPIIARDSIHPVYHGGHCVGVCLCVFAIACSPTPHCILPMLIAH